ncbi:WYL domain-containing protein [Brevibacterium sp. p3-SID960]|uniref:helix-turn-helix transcriptional regulator n=1 Tax=Brevibacterium sp. p3-SID960 TaxID=2916063 RepID=UPI0021A51FED|nr:WYL domain-containing protein [Brevibacterium sp. p3-SID960]MCT1691371.1 WYL domain-containing protein [Brevibacterium sp. p3-SID960]
MSRRTDQRTLDLLGLLATGRAATSAELAAALGTSERSVRRDIAALRESGYRIEASTGPGGGYISPGGVTLPPLQYTADEAFTLALALGSLTSIGVHERGGAVATTSAKLAAVLPGPLAAEVDRAAAAIHAAAGNEPQVPLARIAGLARAIAAGCLADIHHTRGETTVERRVEPYALVVFGSHWYLVAHRHDTSRADGWRTYRLDRITEVHQTTFGFIPHSSAPAVTDPVEFVRQQVTAAVYEVMVTAIVEAPAAEVSERFPGRSGTVEAIDDSRCRVRIGAGTGSLRWLLLYLLSLDVPFTITGPPEARTELERLAATAADASHRRPD